jgi:RNA polymerase sigma-70 factor (ECF subfamily)
MSIHSAEIHQFVKQLTDHQACLRAFIVSLMPGSPDVQDLLQDTNVVIWEKLESYEPGTNFKAWAFSIARNMVKAQFRKTKRNQSPTLNEEIIQVISETWHQRNPEETGQKQIALDFCLSSLDQSARDLITARYTQGNSIETYATTLGSTAESLRVQLFRLRTKLRDCVRKRVPLLEGGAQ